MAYHEKGAHPRTPLYNRCAAANAATHFFFERPAAAERSSWLACVTDDRDKALKNNKKRIKRLQRQ